MIQTHINIPDAIRYALTNAPNEPFTVNDLTRILLKDIEFFRDDKKTRSYVYAHLRRLQLAGILTRKRKDKVMKYEYTLTELNPCETNESTNKVSENDGNELLQIFVHQKARYELELNQAIGEKEVLEDLRSALVRLKADYAELFRDADSKVNRITGKISAVDKLYSLLSN